MSCEQDFVITNGVLINCTGPGGYGRHGNRDVCLQALRELDQCDHPDGRHRNQRECLRVLHEPEQRHHPGGRHENRGEGLL